MAEVALYGDEGGEEVELGEEDISEAADRDEAEAVEMAQILQGLLRRNLALTSQKDTVVLARIVDISTKKKME